MKKRKFVAVVMAFSMLLGQTVYAQEYTTLAETDEVLETEADEIPMTEETVSAETETTVEEETETAVQDLDDSAIEMAEELQVGKNSVEIAEGGNEKVLAYTPSESGVYGFYSTGSEDTYASLYDSDENCLMSNDDGGENYNFKIICSLEGGKTYYLAVKYLNDSLTGSIDVYVKTDMDRCGENAKWSLDHDETLTIKGEGALYDYEDVSDTPWYRQTIKKVIIEEGITALNGCEFDSCSNLTMIQLPSTLKEIPRRFLYQCTALKEVNIPDGVEKIDENAFWYCKALAKAVIPESVKEIKDSAFDEVSDRFYIVGVKGSAAETFANGRGITFVDAVNPVISLDLCSASLAEKYIVYDGEPKTPAVKVIDGDTELVDGEDYTLTYRSNTDIGTASVTIKGNGTTYAGEKTLEFEIVNPSNTLAMGNNFVDIHAEDGECGLDFIPEEDGYYRFYIDTSSIDIFDLESSMNSRAYSDYQGYPIVMETAAKVSAGEQYNITISNLRRDEVVKIVCEKLETSGEVNGVSWNYSEDKVLTVNGTDLTQAKEEYYPWNTFKDEAEKLVIGDQVKVIPTRAFEYFRTLNSVELPDGLTEIQEGAFSDNTSLTSISFPNSLKTIGWYAFWNCGMHHVTIPETVETVGDYSFGYADGGELISNFYIIGAKGSSAEEYAASKGFTFIDVAHPEIPLDLCSVSVEEKRVAYDGTPKTPAITVMDGTKLIEGQDYEVSYQNNKEVGTASVTVKGIGNYSGEKTLEFEVVQVTDKLSLGENYIEIDTENGKNQTDFTPEEDGYYRFKVEKGAEGHYWIDAGFESNRNYNDNWTIITATSELSAQELYRFDFSYDNPSGDNPIKQIIKVVVDNLENSGEINGVSWSYSDDGVLKIDGEDLTQAQEDGIYPWERFKDDSVKIIIGNQVKEIPNGMFSGFKNAECVELPTGLESIESCAFEYCEKLDSIELPETLKSIGYAAFRGCNFRKMEIPESVEKIDEYAVGYDSYDTQIEKFYIIGKIGTAAEKYASDNNLIFIDLDASTIPIDVCNISVQKVVIFDGQAAIPSVEVSFDLVKLEEGIDYTLTYKDNMEVGTGRVIITGIGRYTGSAEYRFNIKEQKNWNKTMTPGNIWLSESNYSYNADDEKEYDWIASDLDNITVDSSDQAVCTVTNITTNKSDQDQTIDFKVHAIKLGKADIHIKDADGTTLFEYHITVIEQPANAVVFEDPVLQSEMVSRYDKDANGYLTEDELTTADGYLWVSCVWHDDQVQSLNGLESFNNIERLSVGECYEISDFSVFKQLNNLRRLYIDGCKKIDDFEWLSECKKLNLLQGEFEEIGCLKGLENLKYFSSLSINAKKVDSWDGLEKLTNLTSLQLPGTGFTDASLLSKMQKLRLLDLSNNDEFTDIQALADLKSLRCLELDNTGVSDEEKWNFQEIPDEISGLPGDKMPILKYYFLIDIETDILDGAEYISELEGDYAETTLLKQGTAKIHVTYTKELSKDVVVKVNSPKDQTLGDNYQGNVEIKKADLEKNENSEISEDKAYLLDSNGTLWSTNPEVKKIQENVKLYIADSVYKPSEIDYWPIDTYLGYYVDNDNTLWTVEHQKIAENIAEAGPGGAIDNKGNFYDLHADDPKPIANVTKWQSGSGFTMILKSDGSVWGRSGYEENGVFSKLSDNVIDIVRWDSNSGGYLKSDGTIVSIRYSKSSCDTEEYHVDASAFGSYERSYYDENGYFYLLDDDRCVWNVKVKDILNVGAFNLVLSEDNTLYLTEDWGNDLIKVDSGVSLLNRDYRDGIETSWQYKKQNGKYYRVSDDQSVNEMSQVRIKNIDEYSLYTTYDNHEQALVKYDTVFLDHVVDSWTDQDKTYALRTDGSVWDVTNAPTKLGSLAREKHEHTIVTDAAVAATTEKPGKTEGSHCSECGEVLTAQKDTVVTTPLNATKADDKGGVDVSWKKVSYADGYLVYRKSGKESWKRAAELKSADDNSWTDTTGTIGTAYTYTVRAYMNSDGENILGGFDSKGVTATVLPATVVLKKAEDNGKKGIDVTWEKVSGATGYRIYRKTSGSSWKGLTNVTSDTTTSYTDSSVIAGITYFYTVRAYKTVNGSDVYGGFDNTGVSASVKSESQNLGAVVLDKTADSGKGSIIVSWKSVEGAEGYRVYKKFAGSSWQKVTNVTADQLSYDDGSGVTGKTYIYTVRAFKHVDGKEVLGGFDSKGLTATKLPAKVTLREAKDNGKGGITVSWNKVSTATGYRVYRKEAGGSWKGLGNVASNATTTYTDQNVTAGKSYVYTIRAYKEYEGKSYFGDYDKTGKTAVVTSLQEIVKLLAATAESGRKITVTWKKAGNCDGYILYRKSGSGSWSRLTKITDKNVSSYTDGSGTAGTTYTYTVRAYKTINGKEAMGGFDSKGVSAKCKN